MTVRDTRVYSATLITFFQFYDLAFGYKLP